MNDRERVLMNIAFDTAGTVHDQMQRLDCGWQMRFAFGHPAAQFIPDVLAEKIEMPMKSGDIVRCKTNPNHAWGISELVKIISSSHCLLKEIGGSRLMNMDNEMFEVLRFMSPSRLYTGTKHKLYGWVTKKAFDKRHNPDADYMKRCGGVEFDGDKMMFWSRSHIWGIEKEVDGKKLHAMPRRFEMQWNDKTKLRDIVETMRSQGFAAEFEYAVEKPTQGQAGYTSITKDELVSRLGSNFA